MNNTQQLKPDPKGKAIASFILGTVSGVMVLTTWLPEELQWFRLIDLFEKLVGYRSVNFPYSPLFSTLLWLTSLFLPLIISFVGFILGVKGLKSSTKRNFALVGIILNILGALIWILFLVRLFRWNP